MSTRLLVNSSTCLISSLSKRTYVGFAQHGWVDIAATVVGQKAAARHVAAFLVHAEPVGLSDIVLQSPEPRQVVTQLRVYTYHPLQTVAAWRDECQPGGEITVGNQSVAQLAKLIQTAHMVEVETEQIAVTHEAVVPAVAECSGEAYQVEVACLVFAYLLLLSPALAHTTYYLSQCPRMVHCLLVERDVLVSLLDVHHPATPDRLYRCGVETEFCISIVHNFNLPARLLADYSQCRRKSVDNSTP